MVRDARRTCCLAPALAAPAPVVLLWLFKCMPCSWLQPVAPLRPRRLLGSKPSLRFALATGEARLESEAASLFQELQSFITDADPSDYFAEGEWDLDGLRSDVEIERQRYHRSDSEVDDEASSLLRELRADGDWDLEGLRSDIAILRSKRAAGAAPAESAAEDLAAFEDILASEWLQGVVTAVTPTGVDVELKAPGGAVGHGGASAAPGVHHVGQVVHVRVVSVDWPSGRLLLSMDGDASAMRRDLMAQLEVLRHQLDEGTENAAKAEESSRAENLPAQDVAAFVGLPPSQWLLGVVRQTASFGAYIEVSTAVSSAWGIAHLTELAEGGVAALSPGQQVWARVLHADAERGRLTLSLRRGPESDTP